MLKDRIQALIEAGVLSLKSEQKKVTTNMVSFNFGSFSEMTIQDGLTPMPKGKIKVTGPSSAEKESRGLIPVTLKSGEVMWIHLDIINGEQWETKQPRCKGKTCNMISFSLGDDDGASTKLLTDSEEEQIVLTAQPAAVEPTGTQSRKTYLR